MGRMKLMRAPLKYVQGRDALLQFAKETEDLGRKYLFICSGSGYKYCGERLKKVSRGWKPHAAMRCLAESVLWEKLKKCGRSSGKTVLM